ncbi:MAG: PEP-CTERM sorting domain-containing protein [Pirellulales bacterium]|nr:PEP-CTERM sorting domain-containing protein [Pirellulales bacterium]
MMIHNFETNRDQAEAVATLIDDYDGHPGTIVNGAVQATDLIRGDVLQMVGTPSTHTEYVKYGDVLNPGTESYTVALWCKLNDAGTTGEALAHKGMASGTGQEGWSLYLSQSDPYNPTIQIRGNYDGTSDNRIKLYKALPFDGQWHHVAMVIDRENGVFKAYLDGQGSGLSGFDNGWAFDSGYYNTIPSGEDIVTTDRLVLGNDNIAYPMDGNLDDFAVWTRALTDAEILDLFYGATFPPRPTHIPGDATGNGVVDGDDARRLAANWLRNDPTLTWAEGDFNGDYVVDDLDASILAGVTYGSGTSLGGELADVLDAYQMEGSAMAGNVTWHYSDDVGGGTTIGMIGGSVAGGDAYIVLGTDGSGVTLVPEPSTFLLLLFAVPLVLGARRRR